MNIQLSNSGSFMNPWRDNVSFMKMWRWSWLCFLWTKKLGFGLGLDLVQEFHLWKISIQCSILFVELLMQTSFFLKVFVNILILKKLLKLIKILLKKLMIILIIYQTFREVIEKSIMNKSLKSKNYHFLKMMLKSLKTLFFNNLTSRKFVNHVRNKSREH